MRGIEFLGVCLLVSVGCSSPPSGEGEPADTGGGNSDSVSADLAGTNDSASTDVGATTPDQTAPLDAGTDAAAVGGCDGACRVLALTVSVGAAELSLDRAYYGLTSPTVSDSGEWELHVEAHRGGADGCPMMGSPSPDQTIIITGFEILAAPTVVTEAEGLVVSVLDFEGALGQEIARPATGEQIAIRAADVCTDCAPDPDSFIAFDVEAPLDGGRVAGHVFATHCGSMDAP